MPGSGTDVVAARVSSYVGAAATAGQLPVITLYAIPGRDCSGSYSAGGLASPAAIEYLRELGVTAVELLPVHYHIDEAFLVERGRVNYWGYNTLGFFAPDPRYSASGPEGAVPEFQAMVRRLHAEAEHGFFTVPKVVE